MTLEMGALDRLVLAAYLAATVALGLRAARRPSERSEDYLLASRSLGRLAVLVTLVATW